MWGIFLFLSFFHFEMHGLLCLGQMRWYIEKHFGIVKGYANVR